MSTLCHIKREERRRDGLLLDVVSLIILDGSAVMVVIQHLIRLFHITMYVVDLQYVNRCRECFGRGD